MTTSKSETQSIGSRYGCAPGGIPWSRTFFNGPLARGATLTYARHHLAHVGDVVATQVPLGCPETAMTENALECAGPRATLVGRGCTSSPKIMGPDASVSLRGAGVDAGDLACTIEPRAHRSLADLSVSVLARVVKWSLKYPHCARPASDLPDGLQRPRRELEQPATSPLHLRRQKLVCSVGFDPAELHVQGLFEADHAVEEAEHERSQ